MAQGLLGVGAWIACSFFLLGQSTPQPGFTEKQQAYERGASCTLHLNAPEGVRISFDISGYLAQEVTAENGQAAYVIDTSLLHAGDYLVRARIGTEGQPEQIAEFPLTISPAHDTERLPVWRWGGGYGNPVWWSKRGFTGAFIGIGEPLENPDASSAQKIRATLDAAARYDYELGFYLHPLSSKQLKQNADIMCLLPGGTRDADAVYPLEPAVIEYAKQTAESWMAAFQGHPGLRHVMFNSEYQTPFCFNSPAIELAQKELGIDLKEIVVNKGGPAPAKPEEIKDGVIEDDNPRYRFLQWWWQRGHGTAIVNQAMHEIVKGHDSRLLTWHEPYRLAPVRGSHAGLDCIGTWTYGYPDIKRLCYAAYLQAAARPAHQLVHQDITLFVYARFVMPLSESTADLSRDFAGKDPYFTASPDYAREALWLVLSQRPDILCFYSAGALSPDDPENDPWFASPETFDAIGETCEEVVKPYGPAIKQCRRIAPRTALLMSAAATWFSESPRLPGYPNEQTLPFATLLMMNHVPFDVLLDEDILEGALDRCDLLVMPRADTLTRSVYERIAGFAEKGGKVIADQSLRATIPHAQIVPFDFTHQTRMDGAHLAKNDAVTAEEDREIMEKYASELAPLLEDIPRPCTAATPRVLVNTLEGGNTRYHFFINDDRAYGPRFGQWKLHFELGVPQTAEAKVAIEGRPALYDVLRRKPIEYREENGFAVFPIRMTAARGKLIAALPEPVKQVEITGSRTLRRGASAEYQVRVLGDSGHPIDAVLPLKIALTDGADRSADVRKYSAAAKGLCTIPILPALNDAAGTWRLTVTDLVAGKTGEIEIGVAP